jgi:predicted lipoprotein with Yx(FWY)xxD motif
MKYRARAFAAVVGTLSAVAAVSSCSGGTDNHSSVVSPSAADASASATYQPEADEQAAPPTVSTKSVALGKILVTSKGLSLYLFQADKTSTSTCNGSCAKAWPPLVVTGKPTAGGGVQSKMLSTSKRSDGSMQVTYNGHPLYRFSGDKKSGDTNGQGLNQFGATWYVLGTDGKQITAKSSQSPSSGGGY